MSSGGGEVGTKTVLFTDVVGSTALRADLGDTAADSLDADLLRLHENAIEGNGGMIVKTLGDGVMATFDGAERAISAAIEVQARVRDRNRRADPTIGLRVGVSTGDVTSTPDGDRLGTPVIEAARLCDAGQAGQILIAEVVRLLAGSRGDHDLIELGPRDYKGLVGPLTTWEVRWDDAVAPDVALPSGLSYAEDFGFVGRERERARLDAAWSRALGGQMTVALIAGEPGAGKTRLTSEFASDAIDSGALLLFGSCEDGLGVPHQPFVESIRHLLATLARPRLGAQAGELVRLVPEIADRFPGLPDPLQSDPETERYQLFNAYVELLADVATDAPVVLVLDDIHWATRPTLQLLRHVVRSKLNAPVLIVATYRDTDIDDEHPLAEALADLHRSDSVERIDLAGLDVATVRSYLDGMAGYDVADDRADALAERLHAETDGNPFFVREVILHLFEAGHLYVEDGRWEAADTFLDAVPAGARDVIGQRLARLGTQARTLLGLASVIGHEFSLQVLSEIGGVQEQEIFDALERAAAARLVEEVALDQYRFTHALVRSALLDDLSVSRRARLHRQVAEAIEVTSSSTADVVEHLAEHWVAAGTAGDRRKAIEFTRAAAGRASSQLAYDQAASLLASALDLAGEIATPDHEMAGLLTDLGGAQHRAGDPDSRETLLRAGRLADRIGATDLLVTSVLENARTAAVLDVDEDRVDLLERALERLGPVPSPERARILANLGFELSFTRDRARVLSISDDALDMAREVGTLADLAFVLSMRVSAYRSPDTLAERLEVCTEIEAVSAELDDPSMQFLAAFRRAEVLMSAGDIAGFRDVVETMVSLSDRLGQPMMAWNTARRRAELALLDGDTANAEQLALEARKIGLDLRLPTAEPIYVMFVAKVFNVVGRPERSVELMAPWPDRIHLIGFRYSYALALLLAGERDEARRQWDLGAANDFEDVDRDLSWIETMALAAEVACDLGDERRARLLFTALEPHRHHLVTSGVGALCSSDHAIGVAALGAGDLGEAVRWLRSSIDHGRSVEAPLLVAGSQVRLAEALLRSDRPGEPPEAAALLAEATETATRHGAGGILDAVRRVQDPGEPT